MPIFEYTCSECEQYVLEPRRDNKHEHIACLGILFQKFQNFPPIKPGHHDIQSDKVELLIRREFQGLLSILAADRLGTQKLQVAGKQFPRVGVIVYY